MQTFTDDNFAAEVLEVSKAKPVLVDFWAVWCGPCMMMMPNLEETAKQIGDSAIVGKVNVDENPNITSEMGVQGIPALKIFRNGEVVQEFTGVTDASVLVDALNSHK